MLIPHPLLGLRDASEFTYLGDASLMQRPSVNDVSTLNDDATLDRFHDYLHLRTNPAGVHRELWFHEQGDRSWLIVTRDTRTHEIIACVFAYDPALPDEATASCEFARDPATLHEAGPSDPANGADA